MTNNNRREWVLAEAHVKYKSGNYVVQILIEPGVDAGQKIKCHVPSNNYDTTAVVKRILKQRVDYNSGKVRQIIDNNKDEKAEEIKMVKRYSNEIFGLALIEGNRGCMVICKSVAALNTFDQVVYEGTDELLHVGMVARSVKPGETLEVTGQNIVAGFIVDTITTAMASEGRAREIEYKKIKDKLQQRKKRFEEDAIWQMLAEKDSEAKELLDQLKAMRGDK